MNPFRYPEAQHSRTQNPARFSDYTRYKPFLRIEFGRQCVYCRLPDGLKGEGAFGVDHYRPVSRFPDLECEYSNLFYVCNTCNWRKGNFWPDFQDWAEARFIPNPCDHRMAEHLRFEGLLVEPQSATGHFAAGLLLLNHLPDVEYREFVLRSIDRCLKMKADAERLLAELEARLPEARETERLMLLADCGTVQTDLKGLREDLERMTGSSTEE